MSLEELAARPSILTRARARASLSEFERNNKLSHLVSFKCVTLTWGEFMITSCRSLIGGKAITSFRIHLTFVAMRNSGRFLVPETRTHARRTHAHTLTHSLSPSLSLCHAPQKMRISITTDAGDLYNLDVDPSMEVRERGEYATHPRYRYILTLSWRT